MIKKLFIRIFIFILFLIIILFTYLSTYGLETKKFNNIISEQITKIENNLIIEFDTIKIKTDVKSLNFYLSTKKPKFLYRGTDIPLQEIKVYIDFLPLLKKQVKVQNIYFTVNDIKIDKLKKIIINTKPSNFKTIFLNNLKKGIFKGNFDLKITNNSLIKSFKIEGYASKLSGDFLNKYNLSDTSFIFSLTNNFGLIEKIQGKFNDIPISVGTINYKKDKNFNIETKFNTSIDLNDDEIKKFLIDFKFFDNFDFNYKLNSRLEHKGIIELDNTLKILDFKYSINGKIKNLEIQSKKIINNEILGKSIKKIRLINSKIIINYGFKKPSQIDLEGFYIFDDAEQKKITIKNSFNKKLSHLNINFDFEEKISIFFLNYLKEKGKNSSIEIDLNLDNKKIFVKKINYKDNKSNIYLKNIEFDKRKKMIKSLDIIKIKTYNKNILNNNFEISYGKKIEIKGSVFDATNLFKYFQNEKKNNPYKNITKEINIKFDNIKTNLSKNIRKFNLIGMISNGKFNKINAKGDFDNEKYLDILLKKDSATKKLFIEVYSDYPEFILSEFSFFKGFSGGQLNYTSFFDDSENISKIQLENFKVKDAPAIVKLLAIADLSGMADIVKRDGLRFETLEMNFTESKGGINLKEMYAIGPSISVLMDGYTEKKSGLVSLRGTMIPAKTLNKFLSNIPIVGKILIPNEVGEGLFGLSFKIKGLPGNVKTTVNPVRSLTPRFIQKALEKKSK